eukprot:COSAG01_NODE_4495_length_4976_cov_16.463605_1_plen_51_part_10
MPSEGWGCDDDVMTVTEDSVCLPCLTGQQPNAVRSSCLECGLREYSTDGSV